MTLLDNSTGVLCQGGQYLDEATNTCQMCPENTWNTAGNGATSCTECPAGLRVDAGKGKREESCKWGMLIYSLTYLQLTIYSLTIRL